jgi:hypothetical protein
MGKKQSNAQGETQLLAEWLMTLPSTWTSKTHVKVGADPIFYAGTRLTPAQSRAFSVWSDWADARVVTPTEVWLVEAKLMATGGAYGQLLDYLDQYPNGDDYQQWAPRPIVGIVLAQVERMRTSKLFAKYGIRTILFSPTFTAAQSLQRIFPAAAILPPTS